MGARNEDLKADPPCLMGQHANRAGRESLSRMLNRFFSSLRRNVVAYIALFIALSGTSYAAVQLAPGSVRTRALANRAVTSKKLAPNSVTSRTIANGSLTRADFKRGLIVPGANGKAGPQGPRGAAGGAFIGLQARSTGSVTAPHGASTAIPLSSNSWTQSKGELDLLAGNATIHIPSSCTGSFGNSLVVNVDGTPNTFAAAPATPAGSTVTVPFVVGTLSQADADVKHTITTSLANSCTQAGEDFGVSNVKLSVLKFSPN